MSTAHVWCHRSADGCTLIQGNWSYFYIYTYFRQLIIPQKISFLGSVLLCFEFAIHFMDFWYGGQFGTVIFHKWYFIAIKYSSFEMFRCFHDCFLCCPIHNVRFTHTNIFKIYMQFKRACALWKNKYMNIITGQTNSFSRWVYSTIAVSIAGNINIRV